MDEKILLVKCIILLYKESLLKEASDSSEIVKAVLANIKQPEVSFGLSGDREIINNLKNVANDMANNGEHEYCREDLIQTLRICTLSNEKLFKVIEDGLEIEADEKILKKNVLSILKTINNYLKEVKITDILNKASYAFKFQRDKIGNASQFISELISQLEPLQVERGSVDTAVINDIDIGNDDSIIKIFDNIKTRMNGSSVYKTGWQELNEMLQGGFRPGECVIIPALQHKYKTGFTLSLFAQIATNNIPLTKDLTKKPLLLRISFEDDLDLNLQFLYQYLKYNETRIPVDIANISVQEMAAYVKEKLQVNGFNIKMLRVDPTQWTYKNVCNKILEYESQGYNVEVLMIDYIGMLPTTGCINTGPMGTDMRDLFRRLRNFTSSRGITLISPHQSSTEAKALVRTGLPESELVKEIAEKGYYSGSKQLDQEVDLELYLHLFKSNKETYISIQRGKHRVPTIIPDELKYFLLKFPKGMPIPENINDPNHIPLRKLPLKNISNAPEDLFKL